MAKTLTILRQRTRSFLDEATTADWTDAEVDREINLAYMKVYTAVVNVYDDYYSETTTIATVADQQEYTLPTDLYKLRRVEINFQPSNSDSVARRALPVPMDSVLRDLGNTALGLSVYRNPAYYVRGTKIGFIPKPTEAGATAIAIWYIKIVSELSAASDEIDIPFPDRYYESIALEAAANLLRKGQQEEVVARQYLVEAKQLREDMQIELEDRISDDSKSIVDTVGEDLDFSTPM